MRSKARESNGETKSVQWLPSWRVRGTREFRDKRDGFARYSFGESSDTFELVARAVTRCLGEPRLLQGRDGLHLVLAAIDPTTFHWGRILQQLRTRRHFRQQCRAMRRIMSCTPADSSFRQRSPRFPLAFPFSPRFLPTCVFRTLFICFVYMMDFHIYIYIYERCLFCSLEKYGEFKTS